MPIYEYRCNSCGRRVSIFLRHSSGEAKCPACGSTDLSRCFSTFSVRGTHKDIYDDILSDNQLTSGLMRNDPKALAEWNRRMTRGMETNEPTPEYEEALEKMDRGIMPQTPIGEMPEGNGE
ncbi:MAG: FmdB family zinc ribbon protein [Chloroflexota bacterium]